MAVRVKSDESAAEVSAASEVAEESLKLPLRRLTKYWKLMWSLFNQLCPQASRMVSGRCIYVCSANCSMWLALIAMKRPLEGFVAAAEELAASKLEVVIPERGKGDEIAKMARALDECKQNAQERWSKVKSKSIRTDDECDGDDKRTGRRRLGSE